VAEKRPRKRGRKGGSGDAEDNEKVASKVIGKWGEHDMAYVEEEDVAEQELLDRLDMLEHRQGVLIKLAGRLANAVEFKLKSQGASIETDDAPVFAATKVGAMGRTENIIVAPSVKKTIKKRLAEEKRQREEEEEKKEGGNNKGKGPTDNKPADDEDLSVKPEESEEEEEKLTDLNKTLDKTVTVLRERGDPRSPAVILPDVPAEPRDEDGAVTAADIAKMYRQNANTGYANAVPELNTDHDQLSADDLARAQAQAAMYR
jgi:hypothetical protein